MLKLLTEKRHELILNALEKNGIVKIDELVQLTETSESTIRRDLTYLENANALKRVYGGATLLKKRYNEPSYNERLIQNIDQKQCIAKYAASLIQNGDYIYIDAGTTTFEMIKYIDKKDIFVITNGLIHINALVENEISAYVIGGKVKAKTKAITGIDALKSLEKFRFDKCFMGANGVHLKYGFTTPDTDEATLKETAISLSKEAYILADENKFGEIASVKFAELNKASIITNAEIDSYERYKEKTEVKVVGHNDLYGNL